MSTMLMIMMSGELFAKLCGKVFFQAAESSVAFAHTHSYFWPANEPETRTELLIALPTEETLWFVCLFVLLLEHFIVRNVKLNWSSVGDSWQKPSAAFSHTEGK